jgi:hypothetical protein
MTQPYHPPESQPEPELPSYDPRSLPVEVRDYTQTTGTFKPPPATRDDAIAGGMAAYRTGSILTSAYDEYVNAHGGPSAFDITEGRVSRIVYDTDENGKSVKVSVPDPVATDMLKTLTAAEKDFKVYDSMLKKGGIFAATSSGGSGSGGGAPRINTDPQDETRRQFMDFLDRAKTLYNLEDEEQAWSMRADDQNIQNKDAAMEGKLNYNTTTQYSNQRPFNERLSDIVRPTIPTDLAPDYRMNEEFGLPGESGTNYPRMSNSGGGLPSFVPGYASGTGLPGGVDPDIEWMIGFNPFASHPGGPFDPKGKKLRGFRDQPQSASPPPAAAGRM